MLERVVAALRATKEFLARNVVGLPGAGRDESRLLWQVLHSEDSLDALLREYAC